MQVLGLKWSFVGWMLWLGDYWSPLQIFIVLIMFFPVCFVLFWLVNVNASKMILWECLKIAVTLVTTSCNNFYYRTVKVPSLCQWEMFTMRYTSSTLVSWWCFDFSWSVMLLCVLKWLVQLQVRVHGVLQLVPRWVSIFIGKTVLVYNELPAFSLVCCSVGN